MAAEPSINSGDELSLNAFRGPRYWPTWALLAALHLAARLPFRVQIGLGAALGRLLYRLRPRERRIARRNLEICFPELDRPAREALLARHFRSVGLSFVEMAMAWFTPLERLEQRVRFAGREHLDAALASGRGVILLSAHFTPVDVGCAMLALVEHPIGCMYAAQRNPMMETIVRRGRSRFAQIQIARDNIRELVRRLRAGFGIVYLPDQTHLGNQSTLLPFFGEPAMTNTATSRLARISGALVVPYFVRRLPDDSGYVVDIAPPFDDFPTDDAAADTQRFVAELERYIRANPDQYLWLYKKFKRRPAGFSDPYAPNAS